MLNEIRNFHPHNLDILLYGADHITNEEVLNTFKAIHKYIKDIGRFSQSNEKKKTFCIERPPVVHQTISAHILSVMVIVFIISKYLPVCYIIYFFSYLFIHLFIFFLGLSFSIAISRCMVFVIVTYLQFIDIIL